MFKNYYFFLTTASLLRLQNTFVVNNVISPVLPLVCVQNVPTQGLLLSTNSPLGRRMVQFVYAFSLQLAMSYRVRLKLVGNGYYVQLNSFGDLILFAGQSHLNTIKIPQGISVIVAGRKKRLLILTSKHQFLVQNFATFLVGLAVPDVYRLKGLRYVKQTLMQKEGKKKFV